MAVQWEWSFNYARLIGFIDLLYCIIEILLKVKISCYLFLLQNTHTHTHTKRTPKPFIGIFRAASVMVDNCFVTSVKFIVCTITTMNSNVNYGIWVIKICQQMFIDFNECITLVRENNNSPIVGELAWGLWAEGTITLSFTFYSTLLWT